MSFFSSKTALTRFKVNGDIGASPIETVRTGLEKYVIRDITNEPDEMLTGWTSLRDPYTPTFDDSSFLVGSYFAFCLRIDKKKVSGKVLKAQYKIAEKKLLTESGRDYLSKTEKKQLKENVKGALLSKETPVPHVFEIVWDTEKSLIWFYSTQKSASEELETLFLKSFNVGLIKLFPYTIASFDEHLEDDEKNRLGELKPINFKEA